MALDADGAFAELDAREDSRSKKLSFAASIGSCGVSEMDGKPGSYRASLPYPVHEPYPGRAISSQDETGTGRREADTSYSPHVAPPSELDVQLPAGRVGLSPEQPRPYA